MIDALNVSFFTLRRTRVMLRTRLLCALLTAAISTFAQEAPPAQPAPGEQSLADIAKSLRTKKKADVIVTEDDARKLFEEIDTTLKFASKSSGFPTRTAVKHKL